MTLPNTPAVHGVLGIGAGRQDTQTDDLTRMWNLVEMHF